MHVNVVFRYSLIVIYWIPCVYSLQGDQHRVPELVRQRGCDCGGGFLLRYFCHLVDWSHIFTSPRHSCSESINKGVDVYHNVRNHYGLLIQLRSFGKTYNRHLLFFKNPAWFVFFFNLWIISDKNKQNRQNFRRNQKDNH